MNIKILLGILIVVVIVAVIGGRLHYFETKQALNIQLETSQSPTISDETLNWKTYTNEKYGYSINYPSDWTIQDKWSNYNRSDILDAQWFNDDGQVERSDNEVELKLTQVDIERIKNQKITADAGIGSRSEISLDTLEGKEVVRKITTFYDYLQDGTTQDKGTNYTIYIPVGTNHLQLIGDIKNKDTLDQMLNTFKYLDTNQMTNWKNRSSTRTYLYSSRRILCR